VADQRPVPVHAVPVHAVPTGPQPVREVTPVPPMARMPSATRMPPLATLPPVSRIHVEAMTGPLGIWQHATGTSPNPDFGVCTDDVARALLVDLRHAEVLGWAAVATSAWTSLRFLGEAFDPAWRRFRNFRGSDGGWTRSDPTEDTQGRAVLALAHALGVREDPAFAKVAHDLMAIALPAVRRLRAVRGIASAALACITTLELVEPSDPLRADAERVLGLTHGLLRWAFATPMGPRRDRAWPWAEPVLTYENALVPRALIVVGRHRGDRRLALQGFETLDWLIATQTTPDGRFSPVGNDGWWLQGGRRARFDQQPVEAAAMILACDAALDATGEPRYRAAADAAYGWFLGANEAGLVLADTATGGCRDGLGRTSVNENQGAESTLSWLMALEVMRAMGASGPGVAAGRDAAGPDRAAPPSTTAAVMTSR
jgi:hypothetical protein